MKSYKVIKLKDGTQFTVDYYEERSSAEQGSSNTLNLLAIGFPIVMCVVQYLNG